MRADLPCSVVSAELMMGADLPSSSLYSTVEHNMEIESIRAHNWGRFRAEKKDSNKDLTSYIAKINRAKGRPRLAIGCVVKSIGPRSAHPAAVNTTLTSVGTILTLSPTWNIGTRW